MKILAAFFITMLVMFMLFGIWSGIDYRRYEEYSTFCEDLGYEDYYNPTKGYIRCCNILPNEDMTDLEEVCEVFRYEG